MSRLRNVQVDQTAVNPKHYEFGNDFLVEHTADHLHINAIEAITESL